MVLCMYSLLSSSASRVAHNVSISLYQYQLNILEHKNIAYVTWSPCMQGSKAAKGKCKPGALADLDALE